MIIRRIIYLLIALTLITGSSCEKLLIEPDPANTPENNYLNFWVNLDRKYSYFTYKNIDWDSIYYVHRPEVHNDMHDTVLFRILGQMILELKDSHTNIWSPFGKIQYDHAAGYPSNFSMEILEQTYLGDSAGFKDGIRYKRIDSIGYMYINSFSTEITDEGFRAIIEELYPVKGYIIDVRDNEGGNTNNSKNVANHFFDTKRLVEINYLKMGPGHDDFSPMNQYINPEKSLGINKKTLILTNRSCYSATNSFVSWMSALPHVSLVGDTTGGGGGTPHFSELPNGWAYRYSANQSFRPDGLNLDLGIPPDEVVYQSLSDSRNNKDSILEFAISYFQ